MNTFNKNWKRVSSKENTVKKYHVISISFLALFFVLLFSGFADRSVYHGIIATWMVLIFALIESKLHFNKRPDLVSWKKFAYGFLIFWFIITSIIMILLADPQSESIISIGKSLNRILDYGLIVIGVGFLVLRWKRLSNRWRATLISLVCLLFILLIIKAVYW